MMTLTAALLFTVLQENATAVRTEKSDYTTAVAKCREAEGLIESDPQGAIDRLTEVIANPKVAAKIERRLRIEERPAEFTPYYNFTPYLYRAQARVSLAKKLEKTDAEVAQKLLAAALEDLKESSGRKVDKAGELVKGVEAEVAKLKAAAFSAPSTPAAADPLVKFRETWDPCILELKFKSALKVIETDKTLSAEQKKGFQASTEQKCRDLVLRQVAAFRPRFVSGLSQGLDRLTSDEFDVIFALPAPDELVTSHPVLDWARLHLAAFRDVQAGRAAALTLLPAAAASAGLETEGANPWFQAVEATAYQGLKAAVTAEVDRSKDAAKADREKARAQAQALIGQWKGFLQKVDPKIQERNRFLADHDGQVTRLLEAFPADLADLDKLDALLEAVFSAASPEDELAKVDRTLEGLEARPNITRESRQRLFTGRAVAAALRGLLAGRSEDAVASELSALRGKLLEVGGPTEVKQYGPRVEKVLAALR